MTTLAELLARLPEPAGAPAPTAGALPPAPTELGFSEDPAARLPVAAAEAGAELVEARAGVLAAVRLALAGCAGVAVSADAPDREALLAALRDDGIAAVAYEQVAGDRAALAALDATVTGCRLVVAATAGLLIDSGQGRAAALIAPLHVCIVERGALVAGLREALAEMGPESASLSALHVGPSRTADIEKTLIMGMHGPARVVLVLEQA